MMEQLAYLGTHPTVPTIVVRAPHWDLPLSMGSYVGRYTI